MPNSAHPSRRSDEAGLIKWLDDRIVGFVELYIQIHEGEIFEKAEYVEDPIAKVKFPKFAAGASIEYGGQTTTSSTRTQKASSQSKRASSESRVQARK